MDNGYLNRIRSFYKVDRAIEKLLKWFSYVSGICIVITAVIATVNVVVQKVFHSNIPSVNDYITYMFVAIVYCAIPHVQMETNLTCVDILSTHFPKKMNLVIAILGDIIGLALYSFIGYALLTNSFKRYYTLKTVAAVGSKGTFVLWPFALLMGVSMFLLAATLIWNNIRRVLYKGTKYMPNDLAQAAGFEPPRRYGPGGD